MTVVIAIILAIAGWFILMLITTNLIGVVVRGFFKDPALEKLREDGHPFIKKEIDKDTRAGVGVTIVFAILIVVFLYLLFRFINIWAVVAALLLMIGRIPDLLWEIHNGRKVSAHDKPKGFIYTLTGVMDWAAIPVLAFGLYSLLK